MIALLQVLSGVLVAVLILSVIASLCSLRKIGPTEVGLVTKRFSGKKLTNDNIIALNGEAGYQADLLMPGLRWKSRSINGFRCLPARSAWSFPK